MTAGLPGPCRCEDDRHRGRREGRPPAPPRGQRCGGQGDGAARPRAGDHLAAACALALRRAGICVEVSCADASCADASRADASRAALEAHGFFMCTVDLEDELVRALGVGTVERVIEAQGELGSLRILQRQPAQRARSAPEQLRRFIGGRSGDEHRYARLLTDALDLDRAPRPLDGVLARL
ncbi:hypothetical protein SAMN05428996_0212 [Quadrisphaera sp. DSM 44207]|nr:hypothetical protein SAMN05428996_0212 [Quadrisphaera sp. DSM 44207]